MLYYWEIADLIVSIKIHKRICNVSYTCLTKKSEKGPCLSFVCQHSGFYYFVLFFFSHLALVTWKGRLRKSTNGQSMPWTQKLSWLIESQKLLGKCSQVSNCQFLVAVTYFLSFTCVLYSPYGFPLSLLCQLSVSHPVFITWDFYRNLPSTSTPLTGRAQSRLHLLIHRSFRAQ